MLYPLEEKSEIAKDHPSCSQMRSPGDVHKSGPGGSDQVLQHLCGTFKESYTVHACPSVFATQKREEWTRNTCGAMVTDMEGRRSDDMESVMPPLLYPE